MNPRPALLTLAASCLLLVAMGATVFAGTVKYPAAGTPYFSFEAPDDWKIRQPSGSTKPLYCVAEDESGLNVQFYTINNVELGDDLSVFAKAALQAGGVKEIEVGKAGDDTVGNDLPAKYVRSSFKSTEGTPFASLILRVPVAGDKSVVIHCFLAADQLDSHKEAIQRLLTSIRPAK